MSRYEIPEYNISKLESKLNTIANKCKKYGADFHYTQEGETFKSVTLDTGESITIRFIIVEVSGSLKHDGYEYVAKIEHMSEGNIVHYPYTVDNNTHLLPTEYEHCRPECEHCKINRFRRNTYVLQNIQTGEYIQLGRNCLSEYTHGLDGEYIAQYLSYFKTVEDYSDYSDYGIREHINSYYRVSDILKYAYIAVKLNGYIKSNEANSTSSEVQKYLRDIDNGRFNLSNMYLSHECVDYIESALSYISQVEPDSEYLSTLKQICNHEYVSKRNINMLVSLIPTYNNHLDYLNQLEKNKLLAESSKHVGNIGDRVDIQVKKMELITSYDSQYGYIHLYRIIDNNQTIFIWRTSNNIQFNDIKLIRGTIKTHSEFRGIKQTELTRCKCFN